MEEVVGEETAVFVEEGAAMFGAVDAFQTGIGQGTGVLEHAGGIVVAGAWVYKEVHGIIFRQNLVIESIVRQADAMVEAAADGDSVAGIHREHIVAFGVI